MSSGAPSLDVLHKFQLAELYTELCEKAVPRTCNALLAPVLMPGDSDSGVPDGHAAPHTLADLFGKAEPHGYGRNRFSRREMEEGFDLVGTVRDPGLPEPKPRFHAATEAEFSESVRVTAEAKAEAEAEAARKARLAAGMKSVMEGSLDAATKKGFVQEALQHALDLLEALKWPAWPMDNGNPFVVKITKTNAARMLVPTYFDVIKTPMDLTRMKSNMKRGRYKSFETFTADVRLIVTNAQTFNAEGEMVHTLAGQLWQEYETRILPEARQVYEDRKTTRQQEVAEEWLRQQQASEAQQRFMAGL